VAGETGVGARRRRIVPTGGNLGSVRLWVLARHIDGLGRGAYLYDPQEHSLSFRNGFDDSELSAALGTTAKLPACVILGAGDLAKCAQKYEGFAYRLIHLDAGIAVGFAHAVAEALGLSLREYADFDIELPRIFGVPRRWEFPLPTFALGVYLGPVPQEAIGLAEARNEGAGTRLTHQDYGSDVMLRMLSATLDRPPRVRWTHRRMTKMPALVQPKIELLEDVLHLRRAVREYSPLPPKREALEAILNVAFATCARRESSGATSTYVRPLLTISATSEELSSGIYEFQAGAPTSMVRRSAFDSGQARECINQLALARSPVSLVFVGDLRTALTRRGSRGYAEMSVAAGAAVGMAWLAVCSYGFVGTAAGGVIPHGFLEATAMDGFNECPLLALHFGLPKSS
jgi:SagB-type dehydrogenase family enzyme